MNSLHLFTIPKWLPNNILPPEIWAIIFCWKWRIEMKDIHKELLLNYDTNLIETYFDKYSDDIGCPKYGVYRCKPIRWDLAIPESKLIIEHVDSNICYHGRECTLYIKSLIRWKNYYVIFEHENEGHVAGGVTYVWVDIDKLKIIHIDSYNDDMFFTDKVLNTMSLPRIIEYFKNSNRNLEDVMSYINKKYK